MMAGAMPQSRYDTDVAIAGAGPVGLTLACALAHHGVRFRIFERKPGPSHAEAGRRPPGPHRLRSRTFGFDGRRGGAPAATTRYRHRLAGSQRPRGPNRVQTPA